MSWELSKAEIGHGEGPSAGNLKKPGGEIDFAPNFKEARQDVPYEFNFNKLNDISGAPGRVDVNDHDPHGGVPDPFCGDMGQPTNFAGAAPDHNDNGDLAPDGSPGVGHGGFALGNVPD